MEKGKRTTLISEEEKVEGKLGKKMKLRKQNCGLNFTNSVSNHLDQGVEKPVKTDYIHVRARRGEATDTHSLAERARREKIRERLQLLQSLVPGCDKITGKAQVLDEIIKYVQSLQNLVEFLAAKLASENSMRIDFEADPLVNMQEPVEEKWCLEFPFQTVLESTSFPQFSCSADTVIATTPTFASTEVFQDHGELFAGLNMDPNTDIRCLDNMCNF